MNMKPLANTLLCLALSLPGGAALADAGVVAARTGTPTAQIVRTNERIDKLLKSRKGADDPAAKAEIRAIAGGLLDYDELARRALSRHWDELKPAQRVDFARTLRQMIEKNYEKKLKSTDVDYKITYRDETVKGDEAVVPTSVKVKTKGKSTDTSVDYKMKKAEGGWAVYDIVTDEVSMVKTYREQFDKIITQESFDALLKKMRKRIQEIEDGDAKKTAPAH